MAFRRRNNRPLQTPVSRVDLANQALLRDQEPPPEANKFGVNGFPRKARELWQNFREAVLADWPEGTRPLCWYHYDCPKVPPFRLPCPGTWRPDNRPDPAVEAKFLKKVLGTPTGDEPTTEEAPCKNSSTD